MTAARTGRTQAHRREQSRTALLESAARALSTYGYTNVNLERVARDAGYTRGALYHSFGGKEQLALAVVEWVDETWHSEVRGALQDHQEDAASLVRQIARAHARFCRRDIAGVMTTLRVEFAGQEHPVGEAVARATRKVVDDCTRLVEAGRQDGSIPAGPPADVVARAVVGAVEGLTIYLGGAAPHDELLADQAVVGLLSL